MSTIAVLLTKEEKREAARENEREIELLRRRQKNVEKRVGALERQVKVIRRKTG